MSQTARRVCGENTDIITPFHGLCYSLFICPPSGLPGRSVFKYSPLVRPDTLGITRFVRNTARTPFRFRRTRPPHQMLRADGDFNRSTLLSGARLTVPREVVEVSTFTRGSAHSGMTGETFLRESRLKRRLLSHSKWRGGGGR